MKWTVFFILLSCYLVKGDYDIKCSYNSKTGLTFEPSNDGVEGRYKVEWCTTADRNVTSWELVLRYDDRAKESCLRYQLGPLGSVHSRFHQPVNLNLSCANVCFTTNLDLIFNDTCYHVNTWLRRHTTSSIPHESLHYITNPYNKEHFTESKAMVHYESDGEDLLVHWFLGYVPATDYFMDLCTTDYMSECEDVTSNCTAMTLQISCNIHTRYGCYTAHLHHSAPWTAAEALFAPLINTASSLCHQEEPIITVPPTQAKAWWAAAIIVAIAFLAALAFWRARIDINTRKRVLFTWLSRNTTVTPPSCPPTAIVVLLYARDCEALMKMASILRELIMKYTGYQVIDLFNNSVVAASAPSASTWIRGLLRRDDVKVVLLQTPAAQQLYCPTLNGEKKSMPTLTAPLMGTRVCPRRPHAADALLALALRALADTAHADAAPYRKYYVAEISGIKAEVARNLTPLRRYVLPEAAPTLLHDLLPPTPGTPNTTNTSNTNMEETLSELRASIESLRDFIRDNPDYLSDELIFM